MTLTPQDQFAGMIAGLEAEGLGRTEIAEMSGVSRTTIWRLVNGVGKNHFHETIAKIETVHRSVVGENNPPVKQNVS